MRPKDFLMGKRSEFQGSWIRSRSFVDVYGGRIIILLLIMMVITFITFTTILQFVACQYEDPAYALTDKACVDDADCEREAGRICVFQFDGCPKGVCACNPLYYKLQNGRCVIKERLGGEKCDQFYKCLPGFVCHSERCRCEEGATMTNDRRFCKQPYHKMLGQKCTKAEKCVSLSDMQTQDGANRYVVSQCPESDRCSCRNGLKEDGNTCRKWHIGEEGCTRTYHCEGGALCQNNKCECPHEYYPVADNSKCAKRGAITELPIMSSCNEIDSERYCAGGLVCRTCHHQTDYKCLKVLSRGGSDSPLTSGATSRETYNTAPLLVITICSIIYEVYRGLLT